METIYLTYDELQQFLMARYCAIAIKNKKQSQQRIANIEAKKIVLIGKSKLLFLSNVQQISLPNDDFFPQLRTLFGVPAGLLVSRNESFVIKPKPSKDKVMLTDLLYQTQRRAMLNACVWGIKNLDIGRVEHFFNQYLPQLSATSLSLYWKVLERIATGHELPTQKPTVESISDTLHDYQLIWLGKSIGECLLGGNKMSDAQRQWFLNPHMPEAPIELHFGDADMFILAYRVVMDLHNADKLNINECMQCVARYQYLQATQKYNLILWAMLIMGMLNKEADNYFMVAGASNLFAMIEQSAYKQAFDGKGAFVALDAFDAVKDAVLNKYDNCVAYYRLKNPNIATKLWEEYSRREPTQWPDALPMIKQADVVDFILKANKVFSIDNFLNKSLIITENEEVYRTLSGGSNVMFFDGMVLRGNVMHWEQNQTIMTDSVDLKQKFAFLSNNIVVDSNFYKLASDEWVLLTADFGLAALSATMLQKMAQSHAPKSIYVFNFNTQTQELQLALSKDKKGKKKNEAPTLFELQAEKNSKTKSTFQAELEKMFGTAKVRIVSKQAYDLPWDMVAMGINVLQKTTLSQCAIVETRFEHKQKLDYEIVLRCFSDVIVYDDAQRYMFMNL